MTTPRFEPIFTLGNAITLASMLIAGAGIVYTNKAETEVLKQQSIHFDQQIQKNTNRLTALEEWKAVGPRFTQQDGAILRAQAVAEAQAYTNGVASDLRSDLKELSKKIDAMNATVNDIRVLLAAQNLITNGKKTE